jgi:HPt (histidine-containing phosphotransfer) domain-containing protein
LATVKGKKTGNHPHSMAITNLSYLRKITDGNKVIIDEMIELFLSQVPVFIHNFHKYYQASQYEALGKEAHKAKSSLQIMGMTDLEQEMKTFIVKAVHGTDVESYPLHIRSFETQCEKAVAELKAEMER